MTGRPSSPLSGSLSGGAEVRAEGRVEGRAEGRVEGRVSVAPLLIIAIGNPSRGDDALGPALLDLLGADVAETLLGVELLTDFQLQVEHALDLDGRRAVLFVDAAWPDPAGLADGGVTLTRIAADTAAPLTSHALRPQAVLQVCATLHQVVPPAWQLAIVGQSFELGAPLSDPARAHLARALVIARGWIGSATVA